MKPDIKSLVLALSALNQAMAERDKASADCDHSWGYFGAKWEDDVEDAQTRFADELDNYIDARIAAVKE